LCHIHHPGGARSTLVCGHQPRDRVERGETQIFHVRGCVGQGSADYENLSDPHRCNGCAEHVIIATAEAYSKFKVG
jgi:hypothetical protein